MQLPNCFGSHFSQSVNNKHGESVNWSKQLKKALDEWFSRQTKSWSWNQGLRFGEAMRRNLKKEQLWKVT